MTQTQMSRVQVARRAKRLYADSIRAKVEREEKIGAMVVINLETGAFEVDPSGLESARILREKRPEAELYGIRIGYRAADAIGGAMERTLCACTCNRKPSPARNRIAGRL